MPVLKRKLVAAAAAVLAVFGAGGAVAATKHGSPGGAEGFAFARGGGRADVLSAAATFLGLSEADLQTQLRSGKTLAQVATARGKSVSDLVAALKAAEVKELDAAVAAGKLTAAQEATIVSTLTQRLTDLVNGTKPSGRPGHAWRA